MVFALKMPMQAHIWLLDNSLFKFAEGALDLVLYVRSVARLSVTKQLQQMRNWDIHYTVVDGRDGLLVGCYRNA